MVDFIHADVRKNRLSVKHRRASLADGQTTKKKRPFIFCFAGRSDMASRHSFLNPKEKTDTLDLVSSLTDDP
jgi:hypothetical protein